MESLAAMCISNDTSLMKKAIAYYRVSTDRQGQSGLGLEAQQEAVSRYVEGESFDVLQEFIEVESGKKNKRPQLTEAKSMPTIPHQTI